MADLSSTCARARSLWIMARWAETTSSSPGHKSVDTIKKITKRASTGC